MDGAVARSRRVQEQEDEHHDGRFGAFLDAQVDKVGGEEKIAPPHLGL